MQASSAVMGGRAEAPELHPIGLRPLSPHPLVSILVSNYNYGRYIAETIESVLAQTYTNFELVICDDGSTDDSVRIVEKFTARDPRVRLIRKDNGGQSSGFNAAFAHSRGEILCLLDSDDVFLPEKVETVVAGFQAAPECGFGVHRVIKVSEQRRRQGVWPMSSSLPCGWHGERLLENGGVLAYMPPTSGLSLRRQVADRAFPLPSDRTLLCGADQMLTRFAPLLTLVMKQEEALSEYRLHDSNKYERSRMTEGSLRRELTVCDQLWSLQRQFLGAMKPGLAARLQAVERHPYIAYLSYLRSRFAGDPEARRCHARYMASIRGIPGARHVWFWRISIWMPRPIFTYAVTFMSRQSALKQAIARWKGLV